MAATKRLAVIAGALAAGLLNTGARAQQQPQEPPVFKSSVNLVEVDVRVFDRDGHFVTDLTRDDFEVLESGALQQIAGLYLVVGSIPDTAAVASGGAARPSSPAPTPGGRQTWIFFFDTNHLVPGAGFDRAKTAVTEFLKTRFKDGDVGGIVAGGRMINNRLTSVREELVTAAAGIKPNNELRSRNLELTREWPRLQDEGEAIQISNGDKDALQRAITRACSDDPSACRNVPPDLAVTDKARRFHVEMDRMTRETLNTVNGLASGLAKIAGPKTVVLLSDGFVAERLETAVQTVVGQTARAGARVYAIDVRGLNRGRGAGIIDQAAADDEVGGPARFDLQADAPNSLAVDTGGLMIRNENNLGRALDRIAQDAGTYYVLGYRPANQEFDGKFRQLEVRVTRDGVRVRARRGYLAIEPARLLTPQPITPAKEPVESPRPADASAPATPTLPPVEPLPSPAIGRVVEGAATGGGHMRMRPDAMDRVRAIAGTAPKDSSSLAGKGWAAYERGDVEAAAVAFTEAAKEPDVRPWVLYALGLSHVALGRYSEAVAVWERVKSAAPEFSAVYIDLADARLQLGDSSSALQTLRDGSGRWPSDPEFHNAIGVIHVRRGALDDGIQAFARAAEVAPDEPLAYFNLGRAYQMRFSRDSRYVASQRRWVAPEGDRKKALESYQTYLKLGGPYTTQAADAIRMLEWAK
jgi:VWFA-related protein